MTLHDGNRVGRGRLAVIAAVLVATICMGTARSARAEERAEHQYATEFGLGVGAVVVDLVYMPVKFVYATLGGLTGGFAYVLTIGRFDVAAAIWRPSLGGTYVVTPSMLRGDEPIHFSGETESEERSPSAEPVGDRGRVHHPGEAY